MVGQVGNKSLLMTWRLNKAIPRFIIISGKTGSGRLTFAKLIMKTLNAQGIIMSNGIDDVREAIQNAYTVTSPTFYIFRNTDDMSVAAKNSLLKVVEEPPNKAYFIMTVENLDNTLATIRSRATTVQMQPYTRKELFEIYSSDKLLEYATVPGELLSWKETDIVKAEKAVDNIIEGLKSKSGTKILRETSLLQAKTTETDKLDNNIVFYIISAKIRQIEPSTAILNALADCKRQFIYQSVNKKAAIECMLIKMLEELKNAEIS